MKNHLREGNVSGLVGAGDEVGRAALFGSASKFEGRNVVGFRCAHNQRPVRPRQVQRGLGPHPAINKVPLQKPIHMALQTSHASQPGLQNMAHCVTT